MTDPTSASAPTSTARTITFRTSLASVILIELFSGVLQVYFTPIFPSLAKQFGVGVASLSWALTGFSLAAAVSTPLFAKLGDTYGHSRVLKIEVGIVAVGCVLIAVAPTFWLLVVGRVLQGTFAAFLPLMFGLIRSRHTSDETSRAVSYLSGVLIFGVFAGLLSVSLILRGTGSSAAVLWLPAVGMVVGFVVLLAVPGPAFSRPADKRIDWPGVVLLAVGFALLLLGISEGSTWGWLSPRTLGAIIVGLVLVATWAVVETRVAQPMIDVQYVFRPLLVPVYVIGFIIYFGAIGSQVTTSTFLALPGDKLGYGLGLAASSLAFYLVPGYFVMFVVIMLTPRIGRSIGYRWAMVFGCVCFFVGYGGLLFTHGSLVGFLVCFWIASGGFGFIEASTRTVVVNALHSDEISIGEGVYELSITVGGAVGSAVLAAVLSAGTVAATDVTSLGAFKAVWGILAALGLVAVVVSVAYAIAARRSGPDVPGGQVGSSHSPAVTSEG